MNVQKLREFKSMYPGVQRTEDVLDKYSFTDCREFRNKKDLADLHKTLDDRYYKPKISAKNRIGEIFARKVLDAIKVSKHERVRRNPQEKAKLDYLDSELKTSPRLKDVEQETDHFEKTTEYEFTSSISRHLLQL